MRCSLRLLLPAVSEFTSAAIACNKLIQAPSDQSGQSELKMDVLKHYTPDRWASVTHAMLVRMQKELPPIPEFEGAGLAPPQVLGSYLNFLGGMTKDECPTDIDWNDVLAYKQADKELWDTVTTTLWGFEMPTPHDKRMVLQFVAQLASSLVQPQWLDDLGATLQQASSAPQAEELIERVGAEKFSESMRAFGLEGDRAFVGMQNSVRLTLADKSIQALWQGFHYALWAQMPLKFVEEMYNDMTNATTT
eukprot:TRINITY_DN67633_c7_g5_i1.p1 TRINITY_DN67633_c7_g5~~TRINITY_DN67633_c7_g5_i1.p1  ORF type:complete len:249 (+),score=13.96 TRINITY_DN67633_c7_g5_i1:23-769(+)